jgi:hypothetical protein
MRKVAALSDFHVRGKIRKRNYPGPKELNVVPSSHYRLSHIPPPVGGVPSVCSTLQRISLPLPLSKFPETPSKCLQVDFFLKWDWNWISLLFIFPVFFLTVPFAFGLFHWRKRSLLKRRSFYSREEDNGPFINRQTLSFGSNSTRCTDIVMNESNWGL